LDFFYQIKIFGFFFKNDFRLINQKDAKEKRKMKIPAKPVESGNIGNTSFFFTQYVMQSRLKDNSRLEDPREALLKMDAEAKADPKYLGPAYSKTQPKPAFMEMTLEQEQEEFKKKQRKFF
jgi:hypothetical protein